MSRSLARPTEQDYSAAKRVVQYLYHHQQIGPTYQGGAAVQLLGYTDADYAGDVATRRSTSGRVFLFMQGPVAWASKQQRTTATSTAQSEYMAISEEAISGRVVAQGGHCAHATDHADDDDTGRQ